MYLNIATQDFTSYRILISNLTRIGQFAQGRGLPAVANSAQIVVRRAWYRTVVVSASHLLLRPHGL